MTQYISKAAVVAEINKVLNSYDPNEITSGRYALVNLRDFLDTLEVKEVDLEKALDNFYKQEDWSPTDAIEYDTHKDIARHFFELGLKNQYSSIGFQNIDDILNKEGINPDSKEAKVIKEAYFVAIDKAFENFKKGE